MMYKMRWSVFYALKNLLLPISSVEHDKVKRNQYDVLRIAEISLALIPQGVER